MNRADKLLSVLRDGRTYSRQEIFERVGFMLTNNAASELRARGFNVQHRVEHGNDVYKLEAAPPSPVASFTPAPNPAAAADGTPAGRDGAGVLTLFAPGPARTW